MRARRACREVEYGDMGWKEMEGDGNARVRDGWCENAVLVLGR